MNPFEMKPAKRAELIIDWEKMWVESYDKCSVDPYTKTRVILMNGTEFENVWFSHQFSRNTCDNELRRQIALIRRSEQLLLHYEEKLGLIALHLKRQQKAAEVESVAEILRRDPSDFLWAEYESRWKEFKECE